VDRWLGERAETRRRRGFWDRCDGAGVVNEWNGWSGERAEGFGIGVALPEWGRWSRNARRRGGAEGFGIGVMVPRGPSEYRVNVGNAGVMVGRYA
jgi:hypothetical protein